MPPSRPGSTDFLPPAGRPLANAGLRDRQNCAPRRSMSLRDAAMKLNTKGGESQGFTLSESIRNSGKVLEEHESKIRQLTSLTETLNNNLKTKDDELQKMQAQMQDRIDKKTKEVEQLQSTARASEMAIRGLEEEIRLLRKQNNEVDKIFRAQSGQPQPPAERKPSPPLERRPSAPRPVEPRPPAREADGTVDELQAQLRAAELLVKQQKNQIEVGESEAATLRRQNTELKNKNALLEKEKAAAERAAKDKTALFEKQAKEREAELKKLKDTVERLTKELAALKQRPLETKGGGDAAALKDLQEKLAQVRKELLAASAARDKAAAALKTAEAGAKEWQGKAGKAAEESRASCVRAESAEKDLAAAREAEQAARARVAQLEAEVKAKSEALSALEKRVEELEEALQKAQQAPGAAGDAEELAALRKEAAELRKRKEVLEAEGRMQCKKLADAEAAVREAGEKLRAAELKAREEHATAEALRKELASLREESKNALAQLCRITELEQALRAKDVDVAEARLAADAARKELNELGDKLRELQHAADKDAADKARLSKEVARMEDELARLKAEFQGANRAEERKKLEEAEEKAQKTALQLQVHKLQMLLRMAEITKLEEHIKCTRRADAIKEEKVGLLTYNLASAESQIDLASEEASKKRQQVREERMAVLNKKQKQEEDKMKTNEESYSTQSKRLKEKLKELEKKVKGQ